MFKFWCELFGHSYDEYGVCSNCGNESIVRVQLNNLSILGKGECVMDVIPVFKVIDCYTNDILDVYLDEDAAHEFAASIATKTFVITDWKDKPKKEVAI